MDFLYSLQNALRAGATYVGEKLLGDKKPALGEITQQVPEARGLWTLLETQSTKFQKASPKERERIFRDILASPDYFFKFAKDDPGLRPILNSPARDVEELRNTMEGTSLKVKTNVGNVRGEAYFSPSTPFTTALGAGAARLLFKAPFLPTYKIGLLASLAGYGAEKLYEAYTGRNAPFFVPLSVDIVSGMGMTAAGRKIAQELAEIKGRKITKKGGEGAKGFSPRLYKPKGSLDEIAVRDPQTGELKRVKIQKADSPAEATTSKVTEATASETTEAIASKATKATTSKAENVRQGEMLSRFMPGPGSFIAKPEGGLKFKLGKGTETKEATEQLTEQLGKSTKEAKEATEQLGKSTKEIGEQITEQPIKGQPTQTTKQQQPKKQQKGPQSIIGPIRDIGGWKEVSHQFYGIHRGTLKRSNEAQEGLNVGELDTATEKLGAIQNTFNTALNMLHKALFGQKELALKEIDHTQIMQKWKGLGEKQRLEQIRQFVDELNKKVKKANDGIYRGAVNNDYNFSVKKANEGYYILKKGVAELNALLRAHDELLKGQPPPKSPPKGKGGSQGESLLSSFMPKSSKDTGTTSLFAQTGRQAEDILETPAATTRLETPFTEAVEEAPLTAQAAKRAEDIPTRELEEAVSKAEETSSFATQATRQIEEPEVPPVTSKVETTKAEIASTKTQPEPPFTEVAKKTQKAQTGGSTGGLRLSSNIKQWEGAKEKLGNMLFYTDDDFTKKLSSALRAGQIDTARAIAEDIHRMLLSNLRVLHRSLFGGELSYEPRQLPPDWQRLSEFERLKEVGHLIKYIHEHVKSTIDILDDRIKHIQEGRKTRNRTKEGEHFYNMRVEILLAYDAIKSAFREVDAILKIGGPITQAKPSSKNVSPTMLRPIESLEKWEEIAKIFRRDKVVTGLLDASYALKEGQIDEASKYLGEVRTHLFNGLNSLSRTLFNKNADLEELDHRPIVEEWTKRGLSEKERVEQIWEAARNLHGTLSKVASNLTQSIKSIDSADDYDKVAVAKEHFPLLAKNAEEGYNLLKEGMARFNALLRAHDELSKGQVKGQALTKDIKVGSATQTAKQLKPPSTAKQPEVPSVKATEEVKEIPSSTTQTTRQAEDLSTVREPETPPTTGQQGGELSAIKPAKTLDEWEDVVRNFHQTTSDTVEYMNKFADDLGRGRFANTHSHLLSIRDVLHNALRVLHGGLFGQEQLVLKEVDHAPIMQKWKEASERERLWKMGRFTYDLIETMKKEYSILAYNITKGRDKDLRKSAKRLYNSLKSGVEELNALLRAYDEVTKGTKGGGTTLHSFTDPVSVSIEALRQTWRTLDDAIRGSKSAEERIKQIDPDAYELLKQQKGGQRLQNIFLKLLPRYDQLAKVPYGTQIFRAAETYTKGFERDLQLFFREDWADLFRELRKLDGDEKEIVRQALEGEIPINQLSAELRGTVLLARRWLDGVFDYAKRHGLIEEEKYRKGYFPHVFDGNIVVSSEKGYRAVGNWDEALEIASKWKDEGLTPKIRVYTTTDSPKAIETFGASIARIDLPPEEVQKVLESFKGQGSKVAEKIVGNLLERRYNIEGYIKDPVKALETYGYRVVKKAWQDELVNEVKPYLDKIQDPALKSGIHSYLRQVLGYPTPAEEALAHTLNSVMKSRIGRILTRALFGKNEVAISPGHVKKGIGFANIWLNHVSMLGWMISTSLMNMVQALHVVPSLAGKGTGAALRDFIRYLNKDQSKLIELYRVGVISRPEVFTSVSPDRLAQVFLSPMAKFDEMARVMTYETAKSVVRAMVDEGKEEAARQFMARKLKALGIQEDDPIMEKILQGKIEGAMKSFAVTFTDRTQFRYEIYASPEVLSGSIARLMFPYKSFLLNYLTLSANYFTNGLIKRNDIKGALTFFAVPLLLGGIYVHPFIGIPFDVLNKLTEQAGYDLREVIREELGPMGVVLTRGLPALGGVDIRHSLEVVIPNTARELFGPIPQAGMKMVGQINQGIDPTNVEDWKAVGKAGTETLKPRFVKAASEAYDMWETGLIRDKKGRIVGEATDRDALLRLLGFQPEEKVRYYHARLNIAKLDKLIERRYEPKFNQLANAIIEGDDKEANRILNEIYNEIERWDRIVENSEGVKRAEAEWMVVKLVGKLNNLDRRIESRMTPYSTDKGARILYGELMDEGVDAEDEED